MTGKVAVFVKTFPKLSETFILGEIAALVESGLDIRVISLNRPTEAITQPDASRFMNRVTYLHSWPGLRTIGRVCRSLLANFAIAHEVIHELRRADVRIAKLGALIDACDRLGIRHLHAHYLSEPALLADLASRIRGTTFSVSAHAKDIYLTDAGTIGRRLGNAAFVSTCTAHNHRYLSELAGSNREKVLLSYHGIDIDRFRPAPAGAQNPVPFIVAVGRYKEKKGFDLLIRACASLLQDGFAFRCEIIGYGDQQDALQQLIAENALEDHVKLRAPVDHRQLVGVAVGERRQALLDRLALADQRRARGHAVDGGRRRHVLADHPTDLVEHDRAQQHLVGVDYVEEVATRCQHAGDHLVERHRRRDRVARALRRR